MKDINILHLSDLHISCNEDPNNAMIRKVLIDDIVNITRKKDISINMVVVTGDIIDRGNLEAYVLAEEMLADLLQQIDVSENQLVIVPGNHDITRDDSTTTLVDLFMKEKSSLEATSEPGWWKFLKVRFEKFSEFVKKVTKNNDEMLSYGIGTKEVCIGDTIVNICL